MTDRTLSFVRTAGDCQRPLLIHSCWPGALLTVVVLIGCAPLGPAKGEGPGGEVAKGDTASSQALAAVYCDSSEQQAYEELILLYPNTDGSGFHRGSFRRISKMEHPDNPLDPSTRRVEYGEYGADSERGQLALEIKRVEVWSEATQRTKPQFSAETQVEQWSYELSDEELSLRNDQGTTIALSKSGETDCGLLDLPLPRGESIEKMVRIEPGRFLMGSPAGEHGRDRDELEHEVTLTRAFYLGATEVTQGEWREHMGPSPSYFSGCGDHCPVENVTWFDAVAYANAVSRQQNLPECYTQTGEVNRENTPSGRPYDCDGYRLPTEAEWEYAYRAATQAAFYNGDITNLDCYDVGLGAIGWFCGNSGDRTQTVGTKLPNGWGLYDMAGNVWEWTADWYGGYPSGSVTDPTGPENGSHRVFRGGSCRTVARFARASNREAAAPGIRGILLGFRLAKSAP